MNNSQKQFNFKMSAELSVDIIKEMIKVAIEKQTGQVVESVIFNTNEDGLVGAKIEIAQKDNVKPNFIRNPLTKNNVQASLSDYPVVAGAGWHGEADEYRHSQ